MPHTVADIARHVHGEVLGDATVSITGCAPADSAQRGDLTFAENEKYFSAALASAAGAVLVEAGLAAPDKTLIQVKNVRLAFAQVLPLFHAEPVFPPAIHPTAVIAPTAVVDASAHLGPHCVVGEHATIGARVVLHGGNHVGANCTIDEDSQLYPNVVLYPRTQLGRRVRVHAGSVLGSDGYGYVFHGGAHQKVLQVGNVVIGDDVEIGANVAIDRGAIGSTVIGKGTKIDNLVQIAHNVQVGEHCLVVGQAGIAGSTRLGAYVTLAGQTGIAGHLKIGDRVTVAAQSGVMHDIPAGAKWLGSPAQPDRQAKREWVALHQLPELVRRVNELERRAAATPPHGPPPTK